jgi:hypothetical protein
MNKKLLKEINHFRKLTNLPLLVEEGGKGGTTIFKEIIDLVFKNEVKYATEGLFSYINKQGAKVTLKPEVAKNILQKDVTTITRAEELEAYQSLHDNLVNKFGAKTIATAMEFELKKITNPITRETTKRFILEKNFNKSKDLISKELDVIENASMQQSQGLSQTTNLPKLNVGLTESQLAGLSAKDANAIRNLAEEISASTTTVDGRIRLYNMLDDARYKSAKRSIDNEIDRMSADSKQKVQPHIDDADIAENEARKAKAEADKIIAANNAKSSNIRVTKEKLVMSGTFLLALTGLLKFLLTIAIIGLLIYGAIWIYKTFKGWMGGGNNSLPSSEHNSWSEPGNNNSGNNNSGGNNKSKRGALNDPNALPDN